MLPLYLQIIGFVPAIIGENTATPERKTINNNAAIASLRRLYRDHACLQKPGEFSIFIGSLSDMG